MTTSSASYRVFGEDINLLKVSESRANIRHIATRVMSPYCMPIVVNQSVDVKRNLRWTIIETTRFVFEWYFDQLQSQKRWVFNIFFGVALGKGILSKLFSFMQQHEDHKDTIPHTLKFPKPAKEIAPLLSLTWGEITCRMGCLHSNSITFQKPKSKRPGNTIIWWRSKTLADPMIDDYILLHMKILLKLWIIMWPYAFNQCNFGKLEQANGNYYIWAYLSFIQHKSHEIL